MFIGRAGIRYNKFRIGKFCVCIWDKIRDKSCSILIYDREDSDNELHRKIRKDIQEPPDTTDDNAFTKEEILASSYS